MADDSGGRGRRSNVTRSQLVGGLALLTLIVVLVVARLTTAPGSESARDDGTVGSTGPATAPEPVRPSAVARSEDVVGLGFTEVSAAAGIIGSQSSEQRFAQDNMTAGAAVADIFGTGRADVYLTRSGLPNSLYRNNGDGTFTDVAAAVGVAGPDPQRGSGPASIADFDGNGCKDIFVAGAPSGRSALYMGDCQHFTEMIEGSGLDRIAAVPDGVLLQGSTVADFDRDGDLDLLVLQWDTRPVPTSVDRDQSACEVTAAPSGLEDADTNFSRLFANDGSGHFEDVTTAVGLDFSDVVAFTGQFVDMTGDGWDDLLVTGDACTSRMFRNDNGRRFVDVTDEAGLGADENAMGSVVADLNGDGLPDWLVTSISYPAVDGAACPSTGPLSGCSGNRLYLNEGNARFTEVAGRYGIGDAGWAWGAAIEDFGDDGRLSVAVANGFVENDSAPGDVRDEYYSKFRDDPVRFWVPVDGTYRDGAGLVGLEDRAPGNALVAFDFDGDGDLDLLVAGNSVAPRLYRNDRPADRHWLSVRLADPASRGNPDGLGARVRVTTSGPAIERTGWIDVGGSYQTQRLPEFHVGLGSGRVSPIRVEVWWPGDAAPQVVDDVRADHVLTVRRSPS